MSEVLFLALILALMAGVVLLIAGCRKLEGRK